MSTRCQISIFKEDNTILSCYCHYDGYVRGGIGEKLFNIYNSSELALKAVETCCGSMTKEKLDIPRYFCHESYHEGLNSQSRKFMIGWLKLNWKKCVRKWNQDTAQEKIQDEIIPQYEKLPKLQPNGKLAPEDRK